MPKVKTSVKKSSKKLVSSKKFKFSKAQAIVLFVALGAVGAFLIFQTFAAKATKKEKFYNWNAKGIGHHVGAKQKYYTTDPYHGNGVRTLWYVDRYLYDAFKNRDGAVRYMWWGPYANGVSGKYNQLEICWAYVQPSRSKANVTFDIKWNANTRQLGSYTVDIQPSNKKYGQYDSWPVKYFCKFFPFSSKTWYPSLEIRARVNSVGDPREPEYIRGVPISTGGTWDNNSFKLVRTGWRLFNK
jgi:hypothetical protein